MNWEKISKFRDILISIFTVLLILSVSAGVIAYGRGWRIDISNKELKPTGLLAATSDPTGAQVLINDKLTTATNNTVNVAPGWYSITIVKESYQPWQKRLRFQGEIVTRADAYLFPTNPSLSALTTTGVTNPIVSPDSGKLAYIIPTEGLATASSALVARSGIWVLDMASRPLGFNRDARQIAKSSYIDFTSAVLTFSPDSKQILASVTHPLSGLTSHYLLETDRLNDRPLLVYDLTSLITEWDILAAVKTDEKLSIMKNSVQAVFRPVMNILSFSPDESKILYEATAAATIPEVLSPPLIGTNPTEEQRTISPGNVYVYDIKEDRNYLIGDAKTLGFIFPIPTPTLAQKNSQLMSNTDQRSTINDQHASPLFWLPTNRNLVLVGKEKIEVMDYDAANRKTIYSGPFWDRFAAAWGDASKIVILTTLNPAAGTLPNLYAVNLR